MVFLRTGICKALDSNNNSGDDDYTDASDGDDGESEFDDEIQDVESTDEAG